MKRIRLAAQARRDLVEAVRFIAERNPVAARALAQRIDGFMTMLASFPEAGAAQLGRSERILQVQGSPYRLIYRSDLAEVVILRIWHGAQAWPPVS